MVHPALRRLAGATVVARTTRTPEALVRSRGLCVDHPDPDAWYPVAVSSAAAGHEAAEALRIRGRRAVRLERLDLTGRIPAGRHGIRSGTTEQECAETSEDSARGQAVAW